MPTYVTSISFKSKYILKYKATGKKNSLSESSFIIVRPQKKCTSILLPLKENFFEIGRSTLQKMYIWLVFKSL